jgi:hypothetical protein
VSRFGSVDLSADLELSPAFLCCAAVAVLAYALQSSPFMSNAKHIHILPSLPSVSTNNGQAERLRGVLRKALQDAMAVGLGIGLGVGVAGCSSGSEPDTTGKTEKQPTICEESARDLGCNPRQVLPDFARFEASSPVWYWAKGIGRKIDVEHGSSCALTADPIGCQTKVDAAIAANVRPGATNCNGPCDSGETFVLAVGDKGVVIIKSQEALASFLAPINNVAEASAVAQFFAGTETQCDDKRAGISCAGDAFTVVAFQQNCGIQEDRWLKVKVPHSGAAPTTEVIDRIKTDCAIGRVPDGCETSSRGGTQWLSLADFWSDCAGLEAASVPAFYLLAEDLRALGAPAALIDEALKSAQDEMRHAAEVFHLAVQAGGQSQEVSVPPRAPKSLFDMAHENAVEGCVRETYGAFIAAYQARTATNPEARAVLIRIAEDELRHAALSHEIAAWAEPQLSHEQRAQIEGDRRQLIAQLRGRVDTNHAAEIYSEAGYPGSEAATRMLDVLEESLWSQVA